MLKEKFSRCSNWSLFKHTCVLFFIILLNACILFESPSPSFKLPAAICKRTYLHVCTCKCLFFLQAEKRAHHNALERKRRDHIKDSFSSLRDAVPALQGEKVASRAQILKKAAEYIQFMRRKNTSHQQDIDDLKRQNSLLESQSLYLLYIYIFIYVCVHTNQTCEQYRINRYKL